MNKNKQFGFTVAELFVAIILIAIIVLSVGGWVANIVKLAGMSFDPISGMAVLRIVGIFLAPLGAVLGFM